VKYLYLAVIMACGVYNSLTQTLAFTALHLSVQYNIPVRVLLLANGDLERAVMLLSLKELSEVRVS
jgi:hypothetical protein